jgi:hypothetical protein
MKLINLKLPEFAFLDGQCHEGDNLEDRDVVIHIRTASIVEFRATKELHLNDDVVFVPFIYKNQLGIEERITCALHYSQALENEADIINMIIRPAIKWYCDYLDWEDKNIINDEIAVFVAENN